MHTELHTAGEICGVYLSYLLHLVGGEGAPQDLDFLATWKERQRTGIHSSTSPWKTFMGKIQNQNSEAGGRRVVSGI